MIGKVGFGRDFQASKDIDNPVNTFQQLTDDLEESVNRLINPWRKYSLSKVWRWIPLSPIPTLLRSYTQAPWSCCWALREFHRWQPVFNRLPALCSKRMPV